jgi:hypothetical protein
MNSDGKVFTAWIFTQGKWESLLSDHNKFRVTRALEVGLDDRKLSAAFGVVTHSGRVPNFQPGTPRPLDPLGRPR